MKDRPSILLVEDSDDDAVLSLRALRAANLPNPIDRVSDGVEALDYLFRQGSYIGRATAELPAVVLLDLRLPRLDGIDVLKAIRADPRTRLVPIVLLTSSAEERDRLAAYEHHVNSYIQKPIAYEEFIQVVREVGHYWAVCNKTAAKIR